MRILIITIILSFSLFAVKAQQPTFEWAIQCGNPPNTTDTKTSLAVNPQGGFYIAGDFIDQAQFGQKTLSSAGGTDIFLVKYDAEGTVLWANRIGGSDYEFVQKIVADNNGDITVAGFFYGNTQIGNDPYTSYGSQDVFIARFDADGNFLWSSRAGGVMADYISGASVDSEQNLIISGYFYGEISFGDTTLISTSSSDVYLAKYNPEGDLLWVTSAGGSSSDQLRSVSFDPQNNILLTGSFYYDVTLGDTTLTTSNPVGVFVASYLPDGQLRWVFQLDGTYLTPDVMVASDQSGSFYISGNFSEEIVFGSKTFDAGEFNQDIFLAKYDHDGKLAWARHAYSISSDQVIGLTVDVYNNVFLTGHYLDTMHFNTLTLPYTLCCGSREIFIVNYSSLGEVLWSEKISGPRANIHAIDIDDQGELFMSGWFTEELLFGPLSLSNFTGYQNYITCMRTELFTYVPQIWANPGIRIFPNPAGDHFRIQSTDPGDSFDLSVYNLGGSLVISRRVLDSERIDISGLPAGYYLVNIVNPSDGSRLSGRIIRQ